MEMQDADVLVISLTTDIRRKLGTGATPHPGRLVPFRVPQRFSDDQLSGDQLSACLSMPQLNDI